MKGLGSGGLGNDMTDGESCRHAQSGSSCGGGYEKAHLWSAFINPDLFLWKRALHQPQPFCPHGDRDPHPEGLEPGVWERMGLGVMSGAPLSSHLRWLSSLPSLWLSEILLCSLILSMLFFPPWPAAAWAKVPLQRLNPFLTQFIPNCFRKLFPIFSLGAVGKPWLMGQIWHASCFCK